MQSITLHEALKKNYSEYADNALMIDILRSVANECRQILDQNQELVALSNQNVILSYETFGHWLKVTIEAVTPGIPKPFDERVLAIANLDFPDDYWRIFKYMVFNDQTVPSSLDQELNLRRSERRSQQGSVYNEQNIWLWDEKSAQPMVILHKDSKRHYRVTSQYLGMAWRILTSLPKIALHYYHYRRQCYRQSILFKDRIGVALHPSYHAIELELIKDLGISVVLVRLSAHDTTETWQTTIQLVERLYPHGIKVGIALLQDRQSIINPQRWQDFLKNIIPALQDKVAWVEVGHAVNRVKWGIWSSKEYRKLFLAVQDYQKMYPHLRIIAPAVIDFEWLRLIDLLKILPKRSNIYALSQHLYVDRRGAPENFQGKFSTLEKVVMSKAISRALLGKSARVILSEVNWPVQHTGVWSPIGSPYTAPEWFRDNPGVSEEAYANYLVRYLAITLGSGMVEQVMWWRLSAKGYGLVDDQDNFRKRPAYFALKQLLNCLQEAEFKCRRTIHPDQYLFEFTKEEQVILLAWQKDGESDYQLKETVATVYDRDGNTIFIENNTVRLSEKPVYIALGPSSA